MVKHDLNIVGGGKNPGNVFMNYHFVGTVERFEGFNFVFEKKLLLEQ